MPPPLSALSDSAIRMDIESPHSRIRKRKKTQLRDALPIEDVAEERGDVFPIEDALEESGSDSGSDSVWDDFMRELELAVAAEQSASSSTASSSSSGPAAPAAAPVAGAARAPAAPPAAALAAHPSYPADIRGDGLAEFRHDTLRNILALHCHHPSHGSRCRLNRVLYGSTRKPAQGRPVGLMLAWARCADQYPDQKSHSRASMFPHILIEENLNYSAREAARMWAKSQPHLVAMMDNLERKREPGEGEEPIVPP